MCYFTPLDSEDHFGICNDQKSGYRIGRKLNADEPWNMSTISSVSIANLVNDTTKTEQTEKNKCWNRIKEESDWHGAYKWKAVLQEMVHTSITAIVASNVSVFVQHNCTSFATLVSGKFVDEHVCSEVTFTSHKSLLEAHRVHVYPNNDQSKNYQT